MHCGWLQLQTRHYHLLSLDNNPKKQKIPNRTGLHENCAFCSFFFSSFWAAFVSTFWAGLQFQIKLGREINWTMVPLSCLEQRSWTIVPAKDINKTSPQIVKQMHYYVAALAVSTLKYLLCLWSKQLAPGPCQGWVWRRYGVPKTFMSTSFKEEITTK